MEFGALLGTNFIVQDGKIVSDWDGKFGTTSFALLKVRTLDGQEWTTLGGGKVVCK